MVVVRNPFFPFYALGFRCNPFRTLTDEEWGEVAILPPSLTDALPEGGHLQILGETGWGKTSTLLALKKYFQDRAMTVDYEYLPDGATTFHTDPRRLDVFLLDEAQRLSRRARRRLLSTARQGNVRLVLGTHRDLSAYFAGGGAMLTTILLTPPSPARLRQILHQRLAYFSLRPDTLPPIADDALDALRRACGDNLRAMERGLYEAFQAWAKAGNAPPALTAAALAPFLVDLR